MYSSDNGIAMYFSLNCFMLFLHRYLFTSYSRYVVNSFMMSLKLCCISTIYDFVTEISIASSSWRVVWGSTSFLIIGDSRPNYFWSFFRSSIWVIWLCAAITTLWLVVVNRHSSCPRSSTWMSGTILLPSPWHVNCFLLRPCSKMSDSYW